MNEITSVYRLLVDEITMSARKWINFDQWRVGIRVV